MRDFTDTFTPADEGMQREHFKNYSIFKLICSEFGHKFSFHAVNLPTANMMLNEWCNYQSFNPADFKVEETQDTSRMHDEYFTN